MNFISALDSPGVSISNIRRALLLAASTLTISLVASAATAQTGPTDEIVVTAQKRAEPLQKVPISVDVLEGADLDKQTSGGTLEALMKTPSISENVSDAGGMTQLSIRGVAPSVPFGDTSGTVGYYVDGVPFALTRSAAVPNTGDFDLSRVEVLRGPQGTLYGASALNGVVHIVTNDADPTGFEGKARLGTSTTEGGGIGYQSDAAINVPLVKDELAIRVVTGFDHAAGWIDQPLLGRRDANYTDNGNIRAKLDYRPTGDLKIDLGAWLSYLNDGAASFGVDGVQPHDALPIPSTTRFGAYNAKIAYDLPFASISSSTSYLHFMQNVYTDTDNALTYITGNSVGQLYSHLPAEVLTEEVLINSENSTEWRWQGGTFYRDSRNDTYQTLPLAFGAGNNNSYRDASVSEAVFGQLTRTFDDDHFEATAGLRYFRDRYETKTLRNPTNTLPIVDDTNDANAVTPRFVLAWLPNKNTNIYASYSEGFRSGLNQQPLALAVNSSLTPANPDKLHNFEIGGKGKLADGLLTYDVSAFYIKWNDVQQSGTISYCNNGVCVPVGAEVNGTSASGPGFDLSLGLHPMHGLNLGGSLSENSLQQDANVYPFGRSNPPSYFKGDRLPFSPQYTGSGFINYTWDLTQDLTARYEISASYRSAEQQILAPSQYGGLNGNNFTVCNNGNHCYKSDSPFSLDMRLELLNEDNRSIAIYGTNITNWNGVTIPYYSESTEFRSRPRTIGVQLQSGF